MTMSRIQHGYEEPEFRPETGAITVARLATIPTTNADV